MGGRGSSSGISKKGKRYGTEFKSLLTAGNVKFVKYNESNNAKDPLETMTKGRVYAVINDENKVNSINFYADDGKRVKSINLLHDHGKGAPHTHIGYYHDEGGTRRITAQERKLVDFVLKAWNNKNSK